MRSHHAKCILGLLLVIGLAGLVGSPVRADVYGSVNGSVDDTAGRPVAGALVALRPESGPALSATTDKAGRFAFPRVPFDTYTISVDAAGFSSAAEILTVSSGNSVSVRFHLSAKMLGRIVTRSSIVTGQPASVGVVSSQTIRALPGNTSLAKVTETVPGVVPFSYNEPVARGFHGVAYEVDGVPIPQTASSEFAEIIDPRDVERLEVFTGAMPAEFGGQRQGAVVDIITKRASDLTGHPSGALTFSAGNYGLSGISLTQSAGAGPFRAFISANLQRSSRGLDSPTNVPEHDNNNQADEFARFVYAPNARDTLAMDFSNQYSAFQIPINTLANNPNDSNFSLPGTDNSQHEYDRFLNLVFNRVSPDGKGYFEVAPWYRSGRVAYYPDPARDLLGSGATSVFQDRRANYEGVSVSVFRGGEKHNFKAGFSGNTVNFDGRFRLQFIDPVNGLSSFADDVAQHGTNLGLYVQDKYYASPAVTVNAGLRYDRSTGFVGGNQLSPRLELNLQTDSKNVVHFYYGRLYAAPALEDVRRDAQILSGSGTSLPVYDLKPETDSVYEAGLAHQFSSSVRGYATLWYRNVANVLDTTQLGTTPIFTLFNSATGRAVGLEVNVNGRAKNGNSYFFSYGASHSEAAGVSGGTFLFPPSQLAPGAFAPEDHDQSHTLNTAYTWNLDAAHSRYATLQTSYGSGFPAMFLSGNGRLPAHWEIDASYGHKPMDGRGLGWEVQGTSLLDHQYVLKINNGFNTTQWAAGRQIVVKVTAPLP
ncbi:MAG: TonB-dependent receptor [Candidatus Eremiobacteraeota bacterium]|nr:TonB-dependent receptor [Candidatus Eremiobacteraeota bacterium]